MLLEGLKIGVALTGSFCTFSKIIPEIEKMVAEGADVYTIVSYSVNKYDTRFGRAGFWKEKLISITGKEPIATIQDAEPIGPKDLFDILIIAPCTGNTIGKLAAAITDTPVLMACKAHLRNSKPVVLSISTNDGLGNNAKNIGQLMNTKNIYFVPYGQDDPVKKPNSLIADTELIIQTILQALNGKQIQPVLL